MRTFFLDENISPHLAPLLDHLARGEHKVCHLFQHFPRGTQDEVWIPEVGRNAWVLVGGDGRQLSRPQQRQLLQDFQVTVFIMYPRFMNSGAYEQAWRLLKAWPEIVKAAEKARPGAWFHVNENGKAEPSSKK